MRSTLIFLREPRWLHSGVFQRKRAKDKRWPWWMSLSCPSSRFHFRGDDQLCATAVCWSVRPMLVSGPHELSLMISNDQYLQTAAAYRFIEVIARVRSCTCATFLWSNLMTPMKQSGQIPSPLRQKTSCKCLLYVPWELVHNFVITNWAGRERFCVGTQLCFVCLSKHKKSHHAFRSGLLVPSGWSHTSPYQNRLK